MGDRILYNVAKRPSFLAGIENGNASPHRFNRTQLVAEE